MFSLKSFLIGASFKSAWDLSVRASSVKLMNLLCMYVNSEPLSTKMRLVWIAKVSAYRAAPSLHPNPTGSSSEYDKWEICPPHCSFPFCEMMRTNEKFFGHNIWYYHASTLFDDLAKTRNFPASFCGLMGWTKCNFASNSWEWKKLWDPYQLFDKTCSEKTWSCLNPKVGENSFSPVIF